MVHRFLKLLGLMTLLAGTTAAVDAAAEESKLVLHDAIQPHMVISQHGIFVAALHKGDVVVMKSIDRGRTFSKPVKAIDVQGRAKGGMHRGPRIGVDGKGALTVTAPVTFDDAEYKKRYPTAELYFVQSTDGGLNWSKPKRVNSVAKKAPEALHWMVVSESGTAHVAWLDMRSRKRGQDIFVSTIRNGDIGDNVSVAKTVCECCAPGLAIDERGNIVLAFREGGDADSREIFAQFSDPSGKFAKRRQVNTVKTMEDG